MSKHPPSIAFGLKIKKLRKSKRLAQKALAIAIGKSTETVSNIERGVHSPRMSTVFDIAAALEVEVRDLFLIRSTTLGTKEKEAIMEKIFDLLKDRPAYFLNSTLNQIHVLIALEEKGRKK
jgi:transcriptional regulator with XRE-family HTH domain